MDKRTHWFASAWLTTLLCVGGEIFLGVRDSEAGVLPHRLEWVWVGLGLLGLYAVPMTLLAGFAWGSSRALQAWGQGQGVWSYLRLQWQDPEQDRRRAASLWTWLIALLIIGACVGGFLQKFALVMERPRNTVLSTALVSMLAVPVGWGLAFVGWPGWYRVVRVLPRPRVVWSVVVMFLGAIGGSWLVLRSIEWQKLPWLLVAGVVLALLVFRGLAFVSKRLGGTNGWRGVAGVLGILLLVGSIWTGLQLGRYSKVTQFIERTLLGSRLLEGARTWGDRDHDNASRWFGGGDCNDNDPDIRPGALDIPGNGIDEDCDGQDLPMPVQPASAASPATGTTVSVAAPPSSTVPLWKGNWLIVTVDTLRADRVHAKRADGTWLMPALHQLAQDSVQFTHVYAQAPNTPRSFPSFLQSRMPSQVEFAKKKGNFSPVLPKHSTVFAALSKAGYHTIGIFSHFYMDPKQGLSQGFDVWDNAGATSLADSNHDIASPRLTERTLEQFKTLAKDKSGTPFVLWVHLFDPHSTYMKHPEFPVEGVPGSVTYRRAGYDGEVAFTDQYLGKILQGLKEQGLAEKTAVVVFADHGESLGIHKLKGERLFYHGESLYDEVLRVPWIMHIPGVGSARTVDDTVMLVDLAPTLLQASGIASPASFQGRSLVPLIQGQSLPAQAAYAEMLPSHELNKSEQAWVEDGWKLYARGTNAQELYHVAEDPEERNNLAFTGGEKSRLATMTTHMQQARYLWSTKK